MRFRAPQTVPVFASRFVLKSRPIAQVLMREYTFFYQTVSILGETDLNKKTFRVQLSKKVADVIADSFQLLGINVPARM
jgi:arginyl-tRNA synthetase